MLHSIELLFLFTVTKCDFLFQIHQTIEALLAFTKQAKKQKSGEAKEILLADENDQFEIQVSVWIVGGTRTKTVPM